MSSQGDNVTDTVVLLYFLLVDEGTLLVDLLGGSISTPRAVYDPDDRDVGVVPPGRADLLSEMRQAIRHYEVVARNGDADPSQLHRVQSADDLYDSGLLRVLDMSAEELKTAATLASQSMTDRYGLRLPLGSGEAACVSIAWHRGYTIVTDDNDALTALRRLHGSSEFAYERVRKLLIRAAHEGRIDKPRANAIHQEMHGLGFWDKGSPFPGE